MKNLDFSVLKKGRITKINIIESKEISLKSNTKLTIKFISNLIEANALLRIQFSKLQKIQ